ncbi:hypothetical protein SBP8a_183 [Bacillus phage SBP8a]|nr:hypothetical protein SBP8a_183 [Bacillus phage SBP8a]
MKVDKLEVLEQLGKWTFNDKDYDSWNHDHFETREEAIVAGLHHAKEEAWDSLFVGKVVEPSISICGDHAIDEAYDQAVEQAGEFADSFMSYVKLEQRFELGDMLTEVFHEWMKKHNLEPTFFTIDSIEEIKINFKKYVDYLNLV